MNGVLLIALTPVALVVGTLVGKRRMRMSWRDDIGLRLPTARAASVSLIAFLVLAVIVELLYRHWGLAEGTGQWRGRYDSAALALRIVAVALVYPIAEELFFRGLVFAVIRRRAGDAAAVAGSALAFTALHLQYDWRGMLLVLADALLYGVVRSRSGSVVLTVALHLLGNSYAVWQRL